MYLKACYSSDLSFGADVRNFFRFITVSLHLIMSQWQHAIFVCAYFICEGATWCHSASTSG